MAAQSDDFTLEAEQNWDTYRVGGTCVFGTQNIIVADVDGDDSLEIVTGGFSYKAENGVRISASQAPLKVWSWNGHNCYAQSVHGMGWNNHKPIRRRHRPRWHRGDNYRRLIL